MALLGLCAIGRWHRDGTEFFFCLTAPSQDSLRNHKPVQLPTQQGVRQLLFKQRGCATNTACGSDQLASYTLLKQKVKLFSNTQMHIYIHSNHLKQVHRLLQTYGGEMLTYAEYSETRKEDKLQTYHSAEISQIL